MEKVKNKLEAKRVYIDFLRIMKHNDMLSIICEVLSPSPLWFQNPHF